MTLSTAFNRSMHPDSQK